jgi:hypothetical protein
MPSKCNNCKDIKVEQKETTTKVTAKTKWKKETQMMRAMAELIPTVEYIVNGYYSWLPSPKGAALQLDLYFPDIKLALEFEGDQHNTYIKYYHKTKQAFYYLQECDKVKADICKQRGITLMKIPYSMTMTVTTMEDLLKNANPTLYEQLVKDNLIARLS